MNIEELVCQALGDLAGGRIFPDFAPAGTSTPYITYQVVGGTPVNFQTGDRPDRANARVQINCWSQSRIEASALGTQIEDTIRGSSLLQPEVVTGRVATFDEETQLRGTVQDFSLWSAQ